MQGHSEQIKILVVDDDPGPLLFIEEVLSRENFTVLTADGGHSAMQLMQQSMPDLLITDIVMDDGEGTDLIIELRKLSRIPILAISGGNIGFGGDYLKMALSFGADDILSKPFYKSELLEKVKKLLGIEDVANVTQ